MVEITKLLVVLTNKIFIGFFYMRASRTYFQGCLLVFVVYCIQIIYIQGVPQECPSLNVGIY